MVFLNQSRLGGQKPDGQESCPGMCAMVSIKLKLNKYQFIQCVQAPIGEHEVTQLNVINVYMPYIRKGSIEHSSESNFEIPLDQFELGYSGVRLSPASVSYYTGRWASKRSSSKVHISQCVSSCILARPESTARARKTEGKSSFWR